METAVIIVMVCGIIFFFVMLNHMSKLQNRPICKRHTWKEFKVEFDDPQYNTTILYCSTCGLLPSADIENPKFIEFYKKD